MTLMVIGTIYLIYVIYVVNVQKRHIDILQVLLILF